MMTRPHSRIPTLTSKHVDHGTCPKNCPPSPGAAAPSRQPACPPVGKHPACQAGARCTLCPRCHDCASGSGSDAARGSGPDCELVGTGASCLLRSRLVRVLLGMALESPLSSEGKLKFSCLHRPPPGRGRQSYFRAGTLPACGLQDSALLRGRHHPFCPRRCHPTNAPSSGMATGQRCPCLQAPVASKISVVVLSHSGVTLKVSIWAV